jgi:arylsulfatase A-like enzyme
MVSILDEQVGEIIDLVTALGLDDNTLIIFTSDNGPHLEGGADPDYFDSNGPFTGYKRDLYEGGIRVPMLAKWKDHIAAGSTSNHPSAFWDILPTVADLIGAPSPTGLDGISFLPTLLGEEGQAKHDFLYWEFHEKGGRQAVRKDQWKLVRYDIDENPDKPLELYNLETDPSEKHNLASSHPDLVKELGALMAQAHTQNEVFKFATEK